MRFPYQPAQYVVEYPPLRKYLQLYPRIYAAKRVEITRFAAVGFNGHFHGLPRREFTTKRTV